MPSAPVATVRRRWLAWLACALCAAPTAAAEFSDGLAARWSLEETAGRCVLEQRVRDFGVVRFTGVVGEPLRLEVLGHQDLFAPGPVRLERVAPPWHPAYPERTRLAEVPRGPLGELLIGDPLATRVLMDFYAGYDATLRRTAPSAAMPAADAAGAGSDVTLQIASLGLRPLYDRFVTCYRGAAVHGWAELERSRIEYPPGASALDAEARDTLDAVARLLALDPNIRQVFIDGHTDDTGNSIANRDLSRARAQAVAEYLAKSGIPKSKLVVRYHGAAYPVADNGTEAGRAQNRRTTVRLERDWEGDVAAR
ncbi:MAG: OmpA family protein [Pseudomonadales bacterium]